MGLFTVIGDPHVTHKSIERAKDLFAIVEAIGFHCIWLGDLQDSKEVIRGKCLNLLLEYFRTSKLYHTLLVGNHDYFNLDCDAHALEAIKLLPNVTVVDGPMVVQNLVFLPYMHDQVKLKNTITEYARPDRTLFAHLELAQFDFGNGHICTTGLTAEDVAGFKRVISGHFHKFQTRGNLTYLGTPYTQSFGEANQRKYLGVYNSETDEFKIAETEFPRHLSVEIDCDNDEYAIDQLLDEMRDDFYRIILTGSQANIALFPKQLFEQFNVKWISRPNDYAQNDVTIADTLTNDGQFRKWATEVKKMDEDTINLGLSIMEACK